uniref:Innexin n=1 Tax=Heterorhabditis bacteriophora TaxID=37862 RepID=A0A1I7WN86_HETBA
MVGGYRIGMHFLASAFRFLEPRVDDDFVDRLHYLYTSTLVLMFAVLVSAKQYGLNAGLVLQLACQEQNVDPIVRNKTVDILARHIDDALMYQRDHGSRRRNIYVFAVVRIGQCAFLRKFYGAYVSSVYVFIKTLHLCNVILQFMLLNSFLETSEYPMFGAHVLYDLFLVLAVITVLNLLFWLCALASCSCRQNFVAKHLDMESDQIGRFTDRFLRPDGVFLLQMIASHAGNLTCAKVTEALWLIFLRRSGKPVMDEKVEGSDREDWESNEHTTRKDSLPRRESWHEPSLPPAMPQLPVRTHYV